MKRQKLVLVALLAILGLSLWYAYWASPRQQRVAPVVDTTVTKRKAQTIRPDLTKTDQRRVRLEILDRGVDAFSEPRRDIFRLSQPRPVPARQPVALAPPPPEVFVPPPMPVARPALAPESSVHFNVLGSLRKDGGKIVFLAAENEIFIVRKGDRFGKSMEFEVEEITDEKVLIRKEDGNFPITVSLLDKTPDASYSPPEPVSRRNPSARVTPRRSFYVPPAMETEEETEEAIQEPEPPVEPELEVEEETLPEESSPEGADDGNMSSLQLRRMIQ